MATHSLGFCGPTEKQIAKEHRTPGQPCPFCGVELPAKGRETPIDEAVLAQFARPPIVVVTTDSVPGWRVTGHVGLVVEKVGHMIRTEKGATSQVVAAVGRAAKAVGADAVVGFRIEISEQVVYGYGTAVTIASLDGDE